MTSRPSLLRNFESNNLFLKWLERKHLRTLLTDRSGVERGWHRGCVSVQRKSLCWERRWQMSWLAQREAWMSKWLYQRQSGKERSRRYCKTDLTFETGSFSTLHAVSANPATPKTCCPHTFVFFYFIWAFILCAESVAWRIKYNSTFCSELRRRLSLGFVASCMGGLFFLPVPVFSRSPSSAPPAQFGTAHCCVARGVKQQVHQSHPEARPGTVRKDGYVIGLALERHVA